MMRPQLGQTQIHWLKKWFPSIQLGNKGQNGTDKAFQSEEASLVRQRWLDEAGQAFGYMWPLLGQV